MQSQEDIEVESPIPQLIVLIFILLWAIFALSTY